MQKFNNCLKRGEKQDICSKNGIIRCDIEEKNKIHPE